MYISGNFVAIERFSIVDWEEVKEAVAEQIEKFVNDGGIIIKKDENKLGEGAYADVYKIKEKRTKAIYAAKILRL